SLSLNPVTTSSPPPNYPYPLPNPDARIGGFAIGIFRSQPFTGAKGRFSCPTVGQNSSMARNSEFHGKCIKPLHRKAFTLSRGFLGTEWDFHGKCVWPLWHQAFSPSRVFAALNPASFLILLGPGSGTTPSLIPKPHKGFGPLHG